MPKPPHLHRQPTTSDLAACAPHMGLARPGLAALALASLFWTQAAMAQTVSLVGMLGGRALLIVDGAPPKSVAAGDSYKGIKVLSTLGDVAVLDIAGKQRSVRVGDAPATVGGSGAASGTRLVLTAGTGGHFTTQGQINGKSVPMVVDTGATAVSLSAEEAKRVGLDYRGGKQVQISTANGVIPAWMVKLALVRVGDVQVYGVDAIVSSGSMPVVLLGNSFLSHFQMTRTNDQMVLEKRY